MSTTSANTDKGKQRVMDPPLHSEPASTSVSTSKASMPSSSSDQRLDTIRFVQPQPIPSTTLLNIEYPGVITDEPASSTSYSSLDRALSTLHPSTLPPLTSTPHEALQFLSKISNEGMRVVECRLGAYATPAHSYSKHGGNNESMIQPSDFDHIYKSPLIGEAVNTNNLVIRIVKRVWRQKKRKRGSSSNQTGPHHGSDRGEDHHSSPQGEPHHDVDPSATPRDQDPSMSADSNHDERRYTGRVKKEYRVEVLGLATKTVRFRSMADYAFQPGQPSSGADRTPDKDSHLHAAQELHKALATMDLETLHNFIVPEQLEDYSIRLPDGTTRSNLGMIPPAFFSRMDVPFAYNSQQNPYSELRVVPRPPHMKKLLEPIGRGVEGQGSNGMASFTTTPSSLAISGEELRDDQMIRYVNRVRLTNIAPQPFRLGRDPRVPQHPLPEVVKIEKRCDPSTLSRLRELLQQRPIWSRVALKNQLTKKQRFELEGTNGKVYFALAGYAMVGGAWRDTIVRFGFDVEKDVQSRIYQRLFLRTAGSHGTIIPLGGTSDGMDSGDAGKAATGPGRGSTDEGEEENEGAGEESVREDEPGGAREASTATQRRRVEVPKTLNSASSRPPTNADESSTEAKNSHEFDGVTLNRSIGNFQLCDISDPLIMGWIGRPNDADLPASGFGSGMMPRAQQIAMEPIGVQWIRDTCDPETGWFTRRAIDLIRALVSARFRSLLEKKTPLPEKDLLETVHKLKRKWAEEDSRSTTVDGSLDNGEHTHASNTTSSNNNQMSADTETTVVQVAPASSTDQEGPSELNRDQVAESVSQVHTNAAPNQAQSIDNNINVHSVHDHNVPSS